MNSSKGKAPRNKALSTLDLKTGQRVRVIGGPRKGQCGSIRDVTDCMYELTIDSGEVAHVWKVNVEAKQQEIDVEHVAELQYKLGKAISRLKAATAEVDELYSLIGVATADRDTTKQTK